MKCGWNKLSPPYLVESLISKFKEMTEKTIIVYPNSSEVWDGKAWRCLMPPKGRGKLPTTRGRKIVPTTSLRKRLNEEQDDPSHPNYNNPPRVPAKIRKTRSTRVPLRDSSISGSFSRMSVTPEDESSSTSDSQGESAEDFRGKDAGTPETQSITDCFPYAEDKDLPSTGRKFS
ncbi:hypothetical protein GIB67_012638 [Kingdonia uniflora]|uniref:Uncharacterized protein n=1 Tax=Kingdonia uniflora TaxID=39325 RepID=A0A7J7NEU0_9MAGN|nr:hypothetical protein GIB67_012638 [Kingdonia uniflora]